MVFQPHLKEILTFVDGHVKFAETKNAALLAIAAGALFVIAQVIAEHPPSSWLAGYIGFLLIGCTLSAAVSLLSFLPATQIPWIRSRRSWERGGGSLLFFGEIQQYDAESYISRLSSSTRHDIEEATELGFMYAEQIIANAKIAAKKFTYHRIALWCLLCGVLTPVVGLALYVLTADRRL
jgi:hypothetical protein